MRFELYRFRESKSKAAGAPAPHATQSL